MKKFFFVPAFFCLANFLIVQLLGSLNSGLIKNTVVNSNLNTTDSFNHRSLFNNDITTKNRFKKVAAKAKVKASFHPENDKTAINAVKLNDRNFVGDDVNVVFSGGETNILPLKDSVKIKSSYIDLVNKSLPTLSDSGSTIINHNEAEVLNATTQSPQNSGAEISLKQMNTAIQFTTPDTVCVGTPVNITNNTTASSYYWNFCMADLLNNPPTGVNLGNPGGYFQLPVFSDFVEENGNYYVFVVNNLNGTVTRLDFGTSLLNNSPTAVDLGNFGGVLINHTEGIQIVKEGGNWYGFVVAGDPTLGDVPQIVKIAFGPNINNPSPIATDWGDIGSMNQPLDLYMFKDGTDWYGFTVNQDGSVIRFNFGTNFNNPPTFVKYTNLGLAYPTGVNVVNENGQWHVFVTTANDNGLTRLDFGASLLNSPVAVPLGNPGNVLDAPRDIYIVKFCDAIAGFVVNGGNNGSGEDIVRLNFNNDLKSAPIGISLGNIGNLKFPHSLSRLFRVGDKVYTFITNVANSTITRLEFPSCTNSSIPSHGGQNPPAITYNAPGTYNINLTIDDGLPTQASFCKQVVVVPPPVHTPVKTIVLPENGSVKIGTANPSSTYQWYPSAPNADSITVTAEGLYIVETSGYGCSNKDSFIVIKQTNTVIQFTAPDTVCVGTPVNITNNTTASSYYWNFCVSNVNETSPIGVNLGNPGGTLKTPVFSDVVEANGNYYMFVVNHFSPSELVRLDFGNSLLNNNPVATNLGSFGNILKGRLGGIQVIFDNGKWYAFVVGGNPIYGETPQLVRVDFGPNIQNTNPVVADLGNLGNMNQPFDLYMFKENGEWHAFTVNQNDGSMTRFYFSNGLDNAPTAQHIPLISDYLTGVTVMKENGNFYAFVTTLLNNSLLRLDFGNSLLNSPTVKDFGTLNNVLSTPRDITILRFCDEIVGFIVNGQQGMNANQLVRLDFNGDILSTPTGTLLGTPGNLSVPHSLSKLFREGDKVFSFITNVGNNTITRLEFPNCTNSSLPGYSGQVPPPITYDAPGTYNINLTTDDGLPTQASFCKKVVVVPQPAHTPIKTIMLAPGDSVKIGTGNVSGNYVWNTTNQNADSITVKTAGLYYVETSGYGCSNIDSFRVIFTTADFSYEQDPCDPLRMTFKNETPGSTVVDWNFGNGQNASGNANPVTNYPSFGVYNVTLTITNSSGLNETVTKEVAVQVENANIIVTNDTTICKGTSIQLNAVAALNYCWTPSATLSASDIANPVASPITTTTYYLNSTVAGANIIVNGDFSAGNTGFTSGYSYVSTNTAEGEYYVGNSSLAWNSHLDANCADHSGTGNMLMVNGNPTPDVNVWSQIVSVMPNTNYAFSSWIQSLFKDNPAQLMFSINGTPIGNMITASLPICNWSQFYTTWNSGNNTTAVISIINKNTIVWGNDFALDDISFAPVSIKRDSVVIRIDDPVIKANQDTIVCEGSSFQLKADGSFANYLWSPATGLSNTNTANPIATPAVSTSYIVEGTTAFGCKASDTVNVTIRQKPSLEVSNDTLICRNVPIQLNAIASNVSYAWTSASGLAVGFIANPTVQPTTNTTYTVQVTDLVSGCKNTDSVRVTLRDLPAFSVSGDAEICSGDSAMLIAKGGTSYEWTSAETLNEPYNSTVTVSPLETAVYSVYITENVCRFDTIIEVNVVVNPTPIVVAQKLNDVNCVTVTAQLSATGAEEYLWSPSANLDRANVHNPVASPAATTIFTVRGVNQFGCAAKDSITITVTKEGNPLYLVPNAFTPNNDGINDCFGLRKWGNIELQEFSIYNRWGERVFFTQNRLDCWDGTYKGIKQPTGAFVYVIRAKTFCGDINRKGLITLIR